MIVVDDYAHHPTAVRATIAAARQYHQGPVIVAFQPHRYSRTAYLARDFADALRGADRVYLAPVYAASETPIPGVSERSIGEPLATAGTRVTYVPRVDDLAERLFDEAPRGSLVLMLGAGNITDIAAKLAHRIEEAGVRRVSLTTAQACESLLNDDDRTQLREIFGDRAAFDEPLAPYTSWKIGGPADALLVVESESELAAAMRLCFKRRLPWFVLGAAATCSSVTAAFAASSCASAAVSPRSTRRIEGDRVIVEAGASANMALVTAKAASLGAVGIGSLSGIPGTVGGSLRMNAGTDREMGDFVRDVWVQSPAKPEAHSVTVQYFYRHTTLARDAVVSTGDARLRTRRPQGGARKKCRPGWCAARARSPLRCPTPGPVSAIPKATRPPGSSKPPALRDGGRAARKCPRCTPTSSTIPVERRARDVASLLARVRRAVRDQFGVELQLEVHLVGVFIDEAQA